MNAAAAMEPMPPPPVKALVAFAVLVIRIAKLI
jgi:hypothetical protein